MYHSRRVLEIRESGSELNHGPGLEVTEVVIWIDHFSTFPLDPLFLWMLANEKGKD